MTKKRWLLTATRPPFKNPSEANTSRHVHEALRHCFGWPFESIIPQKVQHGFIDYELITINPARTIHVEVKAFGKRLNDSMIKKYLVKKGPSPTELRTGILTNLKQWQIFLAGSTITKLTGKPMARVLDIEISTIADITELERHIGYRNAPGFETISSTLGARTDTVTHLLCNDDSTIRAVGNQLGLLLKKSGNARSSPHFETTAASIRQFIANGQPHKKFSIKLFRQAICAPPVAQAINSTLAEQIGAKRQQRPIRQALKNRAG